MHPRRYCKKNKLAVLFRRLRSSELRYAPPQSPGTYSSDRRTTLATRPGEPSPPPSSDGFPAPSGLRPRTPRSPRRFAVSPPPPPPPPPRRLAPPTGCRCPLGPLPDRHSCRLRPSGAEPRALRAAGHPCQLHSTSGSSRLAATASHAGAVPSALKLQRASSLPCCLNPVRNFGDWFLRRFSSVALSCLSL